MKKDTEGFTLVELLISISILVIILGSLSTAMIAFLQTGGETSRRDDHSSGAATAASYLDRDLASARTAITTSTTSCSGKVNALLLQWTEYVATPGSPSPSPGPASTSGYTVAYAVASDPASTATDMAPRFQLERWYCAPGASAASAIVVRGLVTSADFAPSSALATSCPGGRLRVVLKRYGADLGDDYTSQGCLAGRTP